MSAVRDLYERLGITLLRSAGDEAPARCFASPDQHRRGDRHPSVSVNLDNGAWLCHACGARGGAYDAALLRGHTPRTAMELLVSHGLAEPRQAPTPSEQRRLSRQARSVGARRVPPRSAMMSEGQIASWASRLLTDTRLIQRLAVERAISRDVLVRFQIGTDGRRITIPVRAADGELTGVLRWLPFDRRNAPKMLALPGTRRGLLPAPERLPPGPVVLCEGEPDALAAHSAQLPAVAIPGVTGWRTAWAPRFATRGVTVVMDCDAEGRACAQRITGDLAASGITTRTVDLAPGRIDGHDLTDHLLSGGQIDALRG